MTIGRFRWPGAVALLAVVLMACVPARAQAPDWVGGWTAYYAGGVTRIELTQAGDTITGTVPTRGATLKGRVRGRTLSGTWTEPGAATRFEFRLAPDRQSFLGRLDAGDWWTGLRAPASELLPIHQETPRAVLRSVLLADEQARAGVPDAYAQIAQVMRFEGDAANWPVPQKVDAGRDLGALVELTTPHLWDAPELADGNAVTVHLQQAGTAAGLDLAMQHVDGKWWLMAPPPGAYAESRRALLARSDGRPRPAEPDPALPTARDTLRRFVAGIGSWNHGGNGEAVATLDLSELPEATRPAEGALAAQYIARVMARIGPLMTGLAPDDPGARVPYVLLAHPAGKITIAPLAGGSGFRFDSATVRSARDLYSAVGSVPIGPGASPQPPDTPFFQLRHIAVVEAPWLLHRSGPLEQWQALACLILLLAGLLLGGLLLIVLRVIGLRPRLGVVGPVLLICTGGLWQALYSYLGLPHQVLVTADAASAVALAVATVWGGWPLIDWVAHHLGTPGGVRVDDIVLSLVVGILRFVLVLVGAAVVADALSLPTSGVIAGLGISGLAVAFASKETLSNVFGAAILVIDRPFKRGDLVTAGDVKGTIEHVGIRSTRVRTAEDSILVVPNGKLSDATINNMGTRRHCLATAALTLPYGRSRADVDAFLTALRAMLDARPDVAAGRTQLGVQSLGGDGLQVALTCYLVAQAAEELAARESLMLDILGLADRMGMSIGKGHTPARPEAMALAAE